jgi:hypothetical protein
MARSVSPREIRSGGACHFGSLHSENIQWLPIDNPLMPFTQCSLPARVNQRTQRELATPGRNSRWSIGTEHLGPDVESSRSASFRRDSSPAPVTSR